MQPIIAAMAGRARFFRPSPRHAGWRAAWPRLLLWLWLCLPWGTLAQAKAPAQQAALPAAVDEALARARVPLDAVAVLVAPVDGERRPRLAHRAAVPMNPASLMKLVTTVVALDRLGVAWRWSTPIYLDGPVRDGVLQGSLYIRGRGDPKLVSERLWLALRRVQGLGVRQIAGDIVIDRSAFESVTHDPAAFDGEPLKPYNAGPDALLINYKSLVLHFNPDRAAGVARVHAEPPLAGLQLQATVPLAGADCSDWRAALKAEFPDASRIRFAGSYAAACGERAWPLASADPAGFAARAIAGMWTSVGGQLAGQVREGRVPAGLEPALEIESPPLAEVVRDINKFSNNVMAQQLLLTLSLQQRGSASFDASREIVQRWWQERIPDADAPLIANGSGLSRGERISALALTRLLQWSWGSALMPELLASLPLGGVDGTLKRSRMRSGAAHLKTGSLRDVAGVAGYVLGASGQRHVVVVMINHPNAQAARAAIDALVDWAARDQR